MEVILRSVRGCCVCLGLVAIAVGCGGGALTKDDLKKMAGGTLKEVVPASGKVTVDGQPIEGLYIDAYSAAGGAAPFKSVRTDKDGKYCWSTHLNCDGMEPGDYKICFKYIPKMNRKGEGDDQFKGRYADPAKSEFKLTLEKGSPQKDVNYDLTTK